VPDDAPPPANPPDLVDPPDPADERAAGDVAPSAEVPGLRLALFASGGGTNVQAILDAVADGTLDADVRLLVSNTPGAGALRRAERAGVPTAVLDPDAHDGPTAFGEALLTVLGEHGADFVALAGYLRRIPSNVVEAFRGRITNVHPALLPAFGGAGMYGRRVHEAVLAYGAHWTGATVHLVDETYDTGPVVLQEPIPVLPSDTADTLAARVLRVEHALYPEALRLFAEGRVAVDGRRVSIADYPRHVGERESG
jgi:phosphoribosylglycinamide formyltransferase-1